MIPKHIFIFFGFAVASLISNRINAQITIPGQAFQVIDKLQDSTSLTFYTSIRKSSGEPFEILNPLFGSTINTAYPRGYNDGPIWKGRGLTTELHAGIAGKIGKLSYTFFPTVYFSQNLGFAKATQTGTSPFTYQFASIDWVQQFGNRSFVQFHPGQSEIKFEYKKFITTFSTQNYTLGPSTFNPIVLSLQGAGFPHFRFGIVPSEIQIKNFSLGRVEANLLVGLLSESPYFDNNAKNDNRYFNCLTLAFSPHFLPELKIGFNKSLYKDSQFFEAKDLIAGIKILDSGVRGDTINTNDTFDQLASLTIEWVFPEIGFRTYAEFAKNDFTGGFRWTVLEPEHSRAYTIGFEKRMNFSNENFMKFIYEHTNLSRNHTYLWRAEPTFYVHNINKQGYTNQGQLVGAGIGPGGNTDNLGFELHCKTNKYGLLLQRVENNKDYFVVNIQEINSHDVEYSLGLYLQKYFNKIILSTNATYSYNYNRYYLKDTVNVQIATSIGFKLDNFK